MVLVDIIAKCIVPLCTATHTEAVQQVTLPTPRHESREHVSIPAVSGGETQDEWPRLWLILATQVSLRSFERKGEKLPSEMIDAVSLKIKPDEQ